MSNDVTTIKVKAETLRKLRILKLTMEQQSYDQAIRKLMTKASKNNKKLFDVLSLR